MKIAIIHKHYLGDNFVMPSYLSEYGVKTIHQRILSGEIWGYKNHKAYADHNGYQFIEDREPWYDSKPPDWSIWQAGLRALKDPDLDVDWIFFSVNDIIYADFNIRLEKYIQDTPPEAFMASGIYISKVNWRVKNSHSPTWEIEMLPEPQDSVTLSAYSHFIRKCPEAIKFVEMLDLDQRFKSIPAIQRHAYTGDAYLSIWYNGYSEYRKYWHLYSQHDHTRVPNSSVSKSSKTWLTNSGLKEYEDGKALMVFGMCCVPMETTLTTIETYTNKMTENEDSSTTKI